MKLLISIVCTVFSVAGCRSNKSEPSRNAEPPAKAVPTMTVEPQGSGAAPAGSAADPHAGHQGAGSATQPAPVATGPDCATEFDHGTFADKHTACVECEKHRGMGTMEADCKTAIAKPWK